MSGLTEIEIDPPEIDGLFSIGLAACGERNLEVADKLAVATGQTDIKILTGVAIRQILNTTGNLDPRLKKVLISAVYVCFRFGLIARKGNANDSEKDGDWYDFDASAFSGSSFDAAELEMIESAKNMDEIRSVASMIAATKVNWYKENHHTGQGRPSSYIKKVIRSRLEGADEGQAVDVLHRIGHWASTRVVLSQMGLAGIARAYPVKVGTSVMKCSNDLAIRIRSSPAGTARHFLAYALAKRMMASTAIVLCPNWTDFGDLVSTIKMLDLRPASYHIGADYLCTGTADYNIAVQSQFSDVDAEKYLGRTGTFGAVYLNNSTLMRSPHISGDTYKSYIDYNADFESRLTTNKLKQRTPRYEVQDLGIVGGEEMAKKYKTMVEQSGAIKNENVEKFFREHNPNDDDDAPSAPKK